MDKDNLFYKNHQFNDFPKPFKEDEYWEVCRLVLRELKKNPDINSVYLAGSRWVPGISDLDIIVVYKNKLPKIKSGVPRKISEKVDYLFTHNYGSYDIKSFENIFYIIPDNTDFKLLYGKDLKIHFPEQELDKENFNFLYAILIFDLLINRLLFFLDYSFAKKTMVRNALCQIYSLTYTLEMIEQILNRQIEKDFKKRIAYLRNNWFNNRLEDNLDNLLDLEKQSIQIILRIIKYLDEFISNYFNLKNSEIYFRNYKFEIKFDKQWKDKIISTYKNGSLILTNPLNGRKKINYKFILPESFSYFLLAYSQHNGLLNDWIKRGLKNKNNLKIAKEKIPLGISRHIFVLNALVRKDKEYQGLLKIPFSYGLILGKRTLASKLGETFLKFKRFFKK